MTARKQFSNAEIAAAWKNSGGKISNSGQPVGTAKCPYHNCKYGLMQANDYGNSRPSDWVVDHKKALANGGSNQPSNLQAMHNWCNSDKGDKY